jgi:putative membrane protein
MMWWGNWGGMGWWWLVGAIFWIGVIVLIIWGVRELTRRSGNNVGGGNSGSNAMDIARERYARGEISREEFETIKKTL